ncbi:hypothetical protein PYW08_002555 [Mythimna loreyi]|uniref:Uncharacterized protein n=1 Tax=Mythimna loreyi TaxID=667449 RepID=A0ACC2QI73_9NEOP|nr:hypothetical protein PYW08_002555 [Mythimna loreyi]
MIRLHWLAGIFCVCTISIISFLLKMPEPESRDENMKYILQWTSPDTDPFFLMGKGQEQFVKRMCPINNCFITSDRDELNSIKDFDAILFYGPEFTQKEVIFPTERSLHQKYVFVSRESPAYYNLDKPRYDGFFNWTYTYKLNSDIYFGFIIIKNEYGNIIGPKTNIYWMDVNYMKSINSDLKNKLKSKKFAVAWFVSNCQSRSKREKIALKLQKELYIRGLVLDIYSEKCSWIGTKSCPKDEEINLAGTECLRKLETDYYFYLAFENSLSEDYVTEKLLNAVQHHAVPIVFGGADYDRFLPEGSYLNANKLSMIELVNKIVAAILNKEVYYDYFKWTNHYSYHAVDEMPESDYMCSLCSALNDQFFVNQISIYENMREWWNLKPQR